MQLSLSKHHVWQSGKPDSRPFQGQQTCTYVFVWTQSSSPRASPKAMPSSWPNKNLLSSDLSQYVRLLMSFRVHFHNPLRSSKSFLTLSASADLLRQALCFERAVWLIWLIFTAVTPGTWLPYLVVIILLVQNVYYTHGPMKTSHTCGCKRLHTLCNLGRP